jgi:hypothetical protein
MGPLVLAMLASFGLPPQLDPEARRFLWWIESANTDPAVLRGVVDMAAETVWMDELVAAAWAIGLAEYRRLRAAGVPFLALRYDELDDDRAAVASGCCAIADYQPPPLLPRSAPSSATRRRERFSPAIAAPAASGRRTSRASARRSPGPAGRRRTRCCRTSTRPEDHGRPSLAARVAARPRLRPT